MGDRHREFNMSHALTADFGFRHFDAAAIADDPLIFHPLVLTAVALPISDGAENTLAEKTVAFGFERSIINGLGLANFTIRPR